MLIKISFLIGFANFAQAALNMDRAYPSGLWRADYTALVKNRLSQDRHQSLMNIPSQMVHELCPRFDRLKRADKENFWTTFFMAVAYAESDFNNNSGPMAGIMQLTCDNTARVGYGCSMCSSNQRLRKSPLIGIDCAMNIVSHWARRGKLVGSHPYFETLRRNRHFSRKVKPTILTYAPRECGSSYSKGRSDWPLASSKIENAWPY